MRANSWAHRASLFSFALLLIGGLLPGCGGSDGPERYAVSGSVTLDGEPLDTGSILFGPEGDGGNGGGATIENGEYVIPAGSGLLAGKYRVRITSAGSGTEMQEEAPGESLDVENTERIPAEYNVNSEQVIEVTADGDNTFDFEINSN